MDKQPMYIAFKKQQLPPLEITLKPQRVNFKDRLNTINNFEDKCGDNYDIPRIPVYNSIQRAVELCNGHTTTDTTHGSYDIYVPKNKPLKDYYSYKQLREKNLINNKKTLNEEAWYTNETEFIYLETITLSNRIITEDYFRSDFLNEGGTLEAIFTKQEFDRKDITKLFMCTDNKERIIRADKDNYGNRLNRKFRKTSYWSDNPISAILNYLIIKINNNFNINKEDIIYINYDKRHKLYINNKYELEIKKYLKNILFFINIINIPEYKLFDEFEIGYGYKLHDRTFTCNKDVESDFIKQCDIYDFEKYIEFVDNESLNKLRVAEKEIKTGRTITHGLIFKRGEKYRD